MRRGLRLIAEGGLDGQDVEHLAARLGVTSRHVRRLFQQHLGASPQAIAHTRRVHFARRLIDETELPMTEVALGAGFSSLRRFNHAIRDTFRRAPRELRRGRGRHPAPGSIELRVPVREPFDDGVFAFLAARAVPGVEAAAGDEYRRSFEVRTPSGAGARGTFAVAWTRGEPALRVRVFMREPRELISIVDRVARMFDANADATAIAAHLGRDPVLAPTLRKIPGLRLPGAWDPFELAVRAILGQQVTVAGARTLAGRLALAFGEPLNAQARDEITHLFPTPEALARADLARIGLPAARASALRSFARAVVDGTLSLDPPDDLESAVSRLTALPGIGDWTAHYIAMRGFGEPDAFPAGDLGVRRALAGNGRLPSVKEVEARAEPWRPWRAYAVMALWRRTPSRSNEKEKS